MIAMTGYLRIDIVVVGGGPAGSAAATMLARQGWQVVLLERETFPRDHVGESLLPASIPILEELGVLPAVEAQGYLKKLGATMVWGGDKEPWSWFFGETNRRYPHSYQVWRPTFDQLLLDNAAANGVEVRQAGEPPKSFLTKTRPPPSPVIPTKAGIQESSTTINLQVNGPSPVCAVWMTRDKSR